MNAEAPISTKPKSGWQRLTEAVDAPRFMPVIEALTVAALLVIVSVSYLIVADQGSPGTPLTPETVAILLVVNLVPAMALMVLIARRLAIRRASRSEIGGRGRLHVRLVALFSAIAAVPTLLVVVFASLLFQGGMQFWFSDLARTVLTSAENVSEIYEAEHKERIRLDVATMGADMVDRINAFGLFSKNFEEDFWYQTAARQLNETAILTIAPDSKIKLEIGVNEYDRPIEQRFSSDMLKQLKAGDVQISSYSDRVEAIVRLDPTAAIYFYGARKVDPKAMEQMIQARSAASDYQITLDRARTLQFRFNAALFLVSLLIVAMSIWIALKIADRLVRPVGQLVSAARNVAGGDLSARVPVSPVQDEVSILGDAFNRMTSRLEEQTGALISANRQIDSRRAFMEAVLSGVTAGIISVDADRRVSLINSSAEALLQTGHRSAIGQKLAALAPELDEVLDSEVKEDIIQIASGGEPRTLAVNKVRVENGFVITFDDITDQLADQRRAAWSDVARRIAHEIKNPLSPIHLGAERLQRRYGNEVSSDPATFARLTSTIVRQVGDLRRMVDEFSSFARMPKPVFREEPIASVAGQVLFLHEVAHPEIIFSMQSPEPSPTLVCDRRQISQALTNVIKNGVEAIQQRQESEGDGAAEGRLLVRIAEERGSLVIEVSDNGVGLPSERGRITEPYMTTRTKGTGLGLAIVKKIVEEHFGRVEFDDAAGGGTVVRMIFDAEALARLDDRMLDEDRRATD